MDPPRSSAEVDVFDLSIAKLTAVYEVGSYSKMLSDIYNGAKDRARYEHDHPIDLETQHPFSLQEKPVLPRCRECFVVRVTNTQGQRVCFLFQWSDLYNTAFYTETEVVAERSWYIFKDFEKTVVLPPTSQFEYV